MYNKAQLKLMNHQTYLRLTISEIELHGDQIESKKGQSKKNCFKNFYLKQTAMNWNLYLGGVVFPGEAIETYHYQVYGGQQDKERQT